jgi:hypothetical protein
LLYGSKTWTIKARDARRIIAAEMKCMRTAWYTWTDYKTNTHITKEIKTTILDKLQEYKRNWIQHVNRIPHNRLPRVMKHCFPTGRRNHGRPLKRLLDTWDRNGSTSDPTAWQICDDVIVLQVAVQATPCVDWELHAPANGALNCLPGEKGLQCIATCSPGFR